MKHLIAMVFAALLLVPASANAGSKIQLAAPDQAKPGTMSYHISGYEIRLPLADCEPLNIAGCGEYVSISLIGENGETKTFVFTKAEAAAIIAAMAGKKMEKFLLRQLMASGRLTGTVAD